MSRSTSAEILSAGKGFDRNRLYLHGRHDGFPCLALCTREIQLSPKKAFGLVSLVVLAETSIMMYLGPSPVSKALSFFQ